MHNGTEKTLREVMDFYNRGGDDVPNKSAFMTPLELTDAEKNQLVDFMKALEGKPILVPIPELP